MQSNATNQQKGGEKASREFSKCHSKKIQKNVENKKSQLDRKSRSGKKYLSLSSVFILQGISEILKNQLRVVTTGDIATLRRNILCYLLFRFIIYFRFLRNIEPSLSHT